MRKKKRVKKKKKKRENVGNEWMMWLLMWLNRNIATVNTTLQLLNIYRLLYALK